MALFATIGSHESSTRNFPANSTADIGSPNKNGLIRNLSGKCCADTLGIVARCTDNAELHFDSLYDPIVSQLDPYVISREELDLTL